MNRRQSSSDAAKFVAPHGDHFATVEADRQGDALYRHGRGDVSRYAEALAAYKLAADFGIPNAQFYYARMHQYGHGCEQDFDVAWTWYQRAAEGGERRAFNNLGYMLNNGQGRSPDEAGSVPYYLEASKRGMAMGSYNLGHYYQLHDLPAMRDWTLAARFYRLAIKQSPRYAAAYNQMGRMYQKGGYGLEPDLRVAFGFFARAAKLGDRLAPYNIGTFYRDGQFVERDFVAAERYFLESAKRGESVAWNATGDLYWYAKYKQVDHAQALHYYLAAYMDGNRDRVARIGWIYKSGDESVRDEAKAFRYLSEAAELGAPRGVRSLGYCYAYGSGTAPDRAKAEALWLDCGGDASLIQWEQLGLLFCAERFEQQPDFEKARRYFERGTEVGYKARAECLRRLGDLYRDAAPVHRDLDRAYGYFQQAAELGDVEAHARLGNAYALGTHVEKDYAKAYQHLRLAYDAGNRGAIDNLGYLYENGLGLPRDLEQAAEIYRRGVEAELPYSIHSLAMFHCKQRIKPHAGETAEGLLQKSAALGYEKSKQMLNDAKTGRCRM